MKLDENQQKAVEHFQGPALVVAGPGSGKTTVIKERILNLIQKHGVDPEHILAIAFTNAAADEMHERLSLSHRAPKICTLHTFGKELITNHYGLLGFSKKPEVWDADDIKRIIYDEKDRLKEANNEKPVVIYKFEGTTTGRCYIGQTTDPERREREHRTYSSNQELRYALQKGDEKFEFKEIKTVNGQEADEEESEQINLYKNCAAVNLSEDTELIERENPDILVTIYKFKSFNSVECCFGLTTTNLKGINGPEGFKVIDEGVPLVEARRRIVSEIATHKNWAVLNRQDPLQARESNKRRIEVFCQHFNVSYDEVLKNTPKFQDLMKKFDRLKDDIESEKRQVSTGLFEPDKINDLVLRALAKRYEHRKDEANAIDFLDMLILPANMLEKNQDLLREYRNTYRYVFVDEFQDISPLDFRLINLFSENLFAVGDDDQAIYGFRGGDSEIMKKKFGNRENVKTYKITRNYRSTSTIVRHAKALIEHNPDRIPKNLRANNLAQSRLKVLPTNQKAITNDLVKELSKLSTTDFQEIGILARNWLGEINKIQEILDSLELETQGFEIVWEALNDPRKDLYDPDAKNRRIMVIRRGRQKIEVLNIHTAKGREWDKVIFLVNTMYESLPRDGNNPIDERRLFYVAATRARQELVVLDGGNCQFVSEFQNAPSTKEKLEEVFEAELETRESELKMELEEASTAALVTLEARRTQELAEALRVVHRQYELDFYPLRRAATENQNEVKKMKVAFPQQLKFANDTFLEGLIPVLDEFESQIKNLSAIAESNNGLDNLGVFTKRVRSPHTQLLDLLKTHQLKPIETVGEVFNLTYHEKTSLDVYSDEVPAGTIAREEQRGYLLKNQVIRKAEVVVSRGPEFFPHGKLDWIVGRYLDRLTSEFGSRYQLNNVNEKSVRRAIVQHLTEQDDESVRKIHALACINERPDGSPADYCVGPEKTHLCTDDVFRGFWKRMWEVIEQSRNLSESQTKEATPGSSKIKQVQPSVDPSVSAYTEFTDGEIVKGVVVDVNRDEVMIDIGFKSEGYIPASEFDAGQNDLPTVQVGDEIDVYIVRREDSEGQIVLSKKIADQTLIWDEIATAYDTGAPVTGRITERIKGGLRVSVGSLRGFLPASQVELRPIQNLEQYVGQTLAMKVISLSKRRHNIVLSRRAWLEAELVQKRSEVLNTLEVDQRVKGVVKNITDFGTFVDLGGVDGLLHKSEIAWKRINHPSEVVSIGEEIEVKVIQFDRENEEISLSLKRMTSNPWENIEDKYPIGSKVSGVVANIVDYGAFVQLEEGIVGLIHVSEMPLVLNNVSPLDLLSENDELEVTVLKIFKDSQRISLSIT